MPEGSRRSSQRSPTNSAAKRPSSASSLGRIVGRMMSSAERGASSSCTSVNTVCSEGGRPASLSSSASSVSLQDASHSSSSSSSSSSLPYGTGPTYDASSSSSTPKRNGSDISLDLTPLVVSPGGGANCVVKVTGEGHLMVKEAPPRQLSRLERVALEIVETEQAYVRDLKSIVEDYLGCIIDCEALQLKPEQVGALFCNIEDIYEFNSDLLEDLERSPHAAAIAECFVERSEAFDIYTLYCMNYPNSVSVLKDCMKNNALLRFFQERQSTLNHSLPLETYLLKPVQRILKYHLLLQELSKHLEKSDPGFEVVEDAIVTMTAVAWYINDMKRKQEHAVRLHEVEALLVNWSGHDLSGFGELVLEGSFKVQRVKKERAFFLFDRMLLIAKKRLDNFVYSTHIFCCNLLLVETLKDPLFFRVSDQTIPKQQHVVQTKNQEEKRLWVHYLKRLIVENHPASLPQKARQVLGDNFCQSPQFEQDFLKMTSSTSPRLDDIHGYHRGRRQSEPPELMMFTPERSRKSLPLLLEGTLPYRRTRRQSAPAKDLETAFNSNALKTAGSDSTLASSVIEVEAEREEPCLTVNLGTQVIAVRPAVREAEPSSQISTHVSFVMEEEEEELPPLGPPPTLSITEEILEFINQSRAREGLAAIRLTEPDRPEETSPPSRFSCPLKPDICPQTPEQTLQPEDGALRCETVKEIEAEQPEDERAVETNGNMVKNNERSDEDDVGKEIPMSKFHPETSKQDEEREKEAATEDNLVFPDPHVDHHQLLQRPKRDKTIIDKIRSYYEAAEEYEGEDCNELDPKIGSNISCGRVKEWEVPESGNPDGEDIAPSTFVSQVSEGKPVKEEKIQGWEEPNVQVDFLQTADDDIKDEVQRVCREPPGRKTNEELPSECEQSQTGSRIETSIPRSGNGTVINGIQAHLDQEVSGPSSCEEPPTKTTQNENAKGSPCQAKKERWTRHSRIVTANRALFESMRSDVTGIGLFEANPVLMENSERILSKVQTLAQMYSAKASTITVQPYKKRVSASKNKSWTLDKLSTQNQTQICSVPQSLTAAQNPEQIKVSRGWSSTDEQSPTQQNTSRKQTRVYNQNQNQEDPKTQRESRVKKDQNLKGDFQESVTGLPEPRRVGHVTVGDQLQQANRVILSRPRDFISALIKAGEDLQPNTSFISNEMQKTPSSLLENQSYPSIINIPGHSQQSRPGLHQSQHRDKEIDYKRDLPTTAEELALGRPNFTPSSSRDVDPEAECSFCTVTVPGELGIIQNTETLKMVTLQPRTEGVTMSLRDSTNETGSSHPDSTYTPPGDTFNPLQGPNPRHEGSPLLNNGHILQPIVPLPTFTSRSPKEKTSHYTGKNNQRDRDEQSGHLTDRSCSAPSVPLASAFSPRQCPPSPLRDPPTSSSPFRVLPAPSPISTFSITASKTLACLAPPPSFDKGSSIRSLLPSSSGSSQRALFASAPPSLHSPTITSSVSTSSAFTRSLAASCISQSVSQSMAKNKHQPPPTGSSSPPAHLRQCPPSQKFAPIQGAGTLTYEHHPPPPHWSSFLHSKPDSSTNLFSVGDCWQQKVLTNVNSELRQKNESHWSGCHNRVARPFPSSEPSSRVQSPTALTQLCSMPAQNSYLPNKPPCARGLGDGNGTSRNPLGLTLEIPRTPSSVSPQILSPPPIGVSLNVWTNNIATPQPRNPTCLSFPSKFSSPKSETSPFVTHCTSRGSSPSSTHPAASHKLHRLFSSSLTDRPLTPVQSWVDGSKSCDQQQSCSISPRSGWTSCFSSGLQSPILESQFGPEHSALGGRHFTSVPWPDVQEISNKYDDADIPATSCVINSCPASILNTSHGSQSELGDPDLEEGNCRSQLICAFVPRKLCEQGPTSSSQNSPSPLSFLHQSEPQAQKGSCPSALPMYPCSQSLLSNQGNPKASYATTVNLQIAGSGRITSFSTAHVSLTQSLQGGAASRRASMNEPS